jgi:hypothetical protein
MEHRVLQVRRRAAVDPRPVPSLYVVPPEVDTACLEWASWCLTRKFYGAPDPRLVPLLGRLRIRTTARAAGPGIAAGGLTSQAKRRGEINQGKNLPRVEKSSRTAALGCSREHLYRVRAAGAVQAYRTAQRLQQAGGTATRTATDTGLIQTAR